MSLLLLIALFSSCALTLVTPPHITPAPQIAERAVAGNICGYYSLSGLIDTISCPIGTSCLVATDRSPAVGYCPGSVNVPVTSIYGYGNWPSNAGCEAGSACCPAATPSVGKWLFNGGETVFLGCGLVPFTYTAFFSSAAGFANPSTSVVAPASTSATTTNSQAALNTQPASDTTTTPTAPLPSQTSTSSGFSSSTIIIIIVVGAVLALVGGLVFLWFLFMIWREWRAPKQLKYPQTQYAPLSHPNSTTSFQSGVPAEKKKGSLGKWSKIATLISSIFGICGLGVTIYFGIKASK